MTYNTRPTLKSALYCINAITHELFLGDAEGSFLGGGVLYYPIMQGCAPVLG